MYFAADSSRGANTNLTAGRSFSQRAHDLLVWFNTIYCDECSQPIRWWNRRVWLVEEGGCAHLQCWHGQLFSKAYVQLVAEEIQLFAPEAAQPKANGLARRELRQLRESARALLERM